jgi:hypothetical protein
MRVTVTTLLLTLATGLVLSLPVAHIIAGVVVTGAD